MIRKGFLLRQGLIFSFLILIIFNLYLPFHYLPWRKSAGIPWAALIRLEKGQVPYRDFFTFWTPANFYLLFILTRGTDLFFILPLLNLLILIILTALSFFISRIIKKDLLLNLSASLVFLITQGLVYYNHNYLGLIFAGANILLLLKKRRRSNFFLGIAAGILTGLSLNFSLWIGGLSLIGNLLWGRKKNFAFLRFYFPLLFLPLLFSLPWFVWLLRQQALIPALQQLFLYPLQGYHDGKINADLSQLAIFTLAFYFLLLRQLPSASSPLRELFFWGTLYLSASFIVGPNSGRIAGGYFLTAPLLTFYLQQKWIPELKIKLKELAQARGRKIFLRAGQIWLTIMIILALSFKITFNYIARLDYYQQKTIPVKIRPNFTLWMTPAMAKLYHTFRLSNLSSPSGPVLILPWLPAFYYFFAWTNPTPFDWLEPHLYRPPYLTRLIESLNQKPQSIIIYLPEEGEYYQSTEILSTKWRSYLEQNYWRRKKIKLLPSSWEAAEKWSGIWQRQ